MNYQKSQFVGVKIVPNSDLIKFVVVGIMFIILTISCRSIGGSNPTISPTANERMTTIYAESATSTVNIQPSQENAGTPEVVKTETPVPENSISPCTNLVEISDDAEFVSWLTCILESGTPEELGSLISSDGVMLAPSNQGCPDGNCWPFFFTGDLAPTLLVLKGTNIAENCFGWHTVKDQLSVTYSDIDLPFPNDIARSFYRAEDTGGYEFIFERDASYPGGYYWKMLLSVFIHSIEESRGGSSPNTHVCP